MIYCDTSVLVAALTQEANTQMVQGWLGRQQPGQVCVSGWTVTEFSCALSRKVRRGDLTPEQRARVLTTWREVLRDGIELIEVPPEAFLAAASYTDRDELALRAGDALHLAIAVGAGYRLASCDASMSQAAIALGVEVIEII